jgi:N utilization substance protein B
LVEIRLRKRENVAMRRSDQRRDAVFASYQRDVTGRPLAELIADARPLTRELAEGVDGHREELDEIIAEHAKGWTVDRIAPLDINVMRVALYEIEFCEVPVEVAKKYCGTEAPKFVNGILGAVAREREVAK